MSRLYTEDEARALAKDAAREAVAEVFKLLPERQPPEAFSVSEVARMLGVSPRTVNRMHLERNEAGKIPRHVAFRAAAAK